MPETQQARDKILDYLDRNNMSQEDLAVTFGVSKMYMNEVLTGKKSTRSANELILKIVSALKIR